MFDSEWNERKEEHIERKNKAASQEKGLQRWKEHFKNKLKNTPEISDKPVNNHLFLTIRGDWGYGE